LFAIFENFRRRIASILAGRNTVAEIPVVGRAETREEAVVPAVAHSRRKHPLLWNVVNSDRRRKAWCGPTAVAALIGVDAALVRDHIKWQRGGRPVKGTCATEIENAFRHFGYDMTLVEDLRADPPTLATWERSRTRPDDAYLIIVSNHWIAVRGHWLCDTFTGGVPVPLRKAPHRRKRIKYVYRITVAAQVPRAA
jgi:hypothetical protein